MWYQHNIPLQVSGYLSLYCFNSLDTYSSKETKGKLFHRLHHSTSAWW